MKKFFICIILINSIILSCIAFASPSKEFSHFIVRFDTGNSYDITIKKNLLRWKGIAGEDLNMTLKIPFKHIVLSKNIDIYQWNEKRGYFVTFMVDKSNAVAATSTKNSNNKEWLVKGKVDFIN